MFGYKEDGLFLDVFAALAAPFQPHEVKVRSQSGRQLHYVTARTVMNRLDEVVGPVNWWDSYEPHENSVKCMLTVRLPDGSTLTKCDAGGYAGMQDSGDDDKSGYSDGFKRTAAKFGVGRYLYRDGVPDFAAALHTAGDVRPAPQREEAQSAPRRADPPARHEPQAGPGPAPRREPPPQGNGTPPPQGTPPRTGKALFAWTKDVEQKYEIGMLKYLNGWAKLQEFPGRMVDWDGEQVALAYKEAVRKLQAFTASDGRDRSYEEALSN